ncbi:hypothetical protein PFISCL1PPCAC_27672, partial [Pristionchus fissidentatus]
PLSLSQLELDPAASPAIEEIHPQRIATASTIFSEPTVERQESSFRPSQHSVDSETEDELEEEEEEPVFAQFFITAKSQLATLFKRCQDCGGLIDPISLLWKQTASALSVTYHCTKCKNHFRFDSQQKKGRGRSKVYELNQSLPVAAFITGCPIPRLAEMCDLLSVAVPRERSMREMIRLYGCPSIDRVYSEWESDVRSLCMDAAPDEGITVAVDGQYDSPGWKASNHKSTVFDSSLRLAISAVSMHASDPGIDNYSIRMESHATEKALEELVDFGFTIRTRISDSNATVDKRVRENAKLAGIETRRDFWHVQKSMRKEWWSGMKRVDCPTLFAWYTSFFNHLYFINEKYPKTEDRPLALEYVRSFVHHCTGKHKWKKKQEFKLIDRCTHDVAVEKKKKKKKRGRKTKKDKKAEEEGSVEHQLIVSLVFSPKFEKAFLQSSADAGTAICECYHSLALMYAPKRLACSASYYNKKMKLGVLHHNSLILSEMMGERKEIGDVVMPRKGRIALAVKRKMSKGTHSWRMEIIDMCWVVREEYEDKRFLRRIGAPEDDIFDELILDYDRIVQEEMWDGDYSDESDSDESM